VASTPLTPTEVHYREAEKTLAVLGSLGADETEATREAVAGLAHSVLALTSALTEVLRR
jgi:hypothetical protein